MKLDLHLESPIILLPFKHDGSELNETWVLNLGDLKVKTNEKACKPNMTNEEKALDMYSISLTEVKMRYFP